MPAPTDPIALDPWLRLCLSPGLTPGGQRLLLRAFGTPQAVALAPQAALRAVVGDRMAMAYLDGPEPGRLDSTREWLRDGPDRHVLTLGDEDYPQALLDIPDPPTLLYAQGKTPLLNRPAMAVVGSRNATKQGLADAQSFARALSDAGHVIVSGLALGIDTAAHRGGMMGRSGSIAVVGTGLDRVYPAANRALAHQLAGEGALISEFPLGTPALASNFPRRNRLISGLSRGVLVVEAALLSGSLTTAKLALEQGRDVFAIPGSIHSPLAKGCHWLIKQGAKLVEASEDLLGELPAIAELPGPGPVEAEPGLLEALAHSPVSADSLALRTGRSVADIAAELTRLEISGEVERLAGGTFRRLVRER